MPSNIIARFLEMPRLILLPLDLLSLSYQGYGSWDHSREYADCIASLERIGLQWDEGNSGSFDGQWLQALVQATQGGIASSTGDSHYAAALARDISLVLKAWCLGHDDPRFGGVWVSYCAGVAPYRSVPRVTEPPDRLLSLKANAARALLGLPLFNQPVAAVRPPPNLLRGQAISLVGEIVTRCDALPASAQVPSDWLDAIAAQEVDGLLIAVERLWGGAIDRLPSFRQFLQTQCIGIAIVLRESQAVGLAYLAQVAARKDADAVLGGFWGGLPLKDACESHDSSPVVPLVLQDFYRFLHDGLGVIGGQASCPVARSDVRLIDWVPDGQEMFGSRRVCVFATDKVGKQLGVDLEAAGTHAATSGIVSSMEPNVTPQSGLDPLKEWDRLIAEAACKFFLRRDAIHVGRRTRFFGDYEEMLGTVVAFDPLSERVAVKPDGWSTAMPPIIVDLGQLAPPRLLTDEASRE